jgi:hypothetical protein
MKLQKKNVKLKSKQEVRAHPTAKGSTPCGNSERASDLAPGLDRWLIQPTSLLVIWSDQKNPSVNRLR